MSDTQPLARAGSGRAAATLAESRIGTVVLTVQYSTRASYYLDWADAFLTSPLFEATAFNLFRRDQQRAAMQAVEKAELVVALHACSADTLRYITPLEGALAARRGRLLVLVGNEYNLPWMPVAERRAFLQRVDADWVGTQLPIECGRWLYEGTGARVVALPHALNDAAFRRETPDGARPIDIGGRSARYPAYLGDDERNRVYDRFAELGPAAGLRIDIGNSGRLDRSAWAAFLNDCRGTIGTEAGTWYLERDDRTVLAVRDYLKGRAGGLTLRADGFAHGAGRRLPYPVKEGLKRLLRALPLRHEAFDDDGASFDDIKGRFFDGRARCPVYSKCISSRHFDAAGTGTCQILLRGRYNDILEPDQHYLALDPDLGNARAALERFRDPGERRRIAENAFALAHDRHTYRHRLAELHRTLTAA
ncbi:MAG: glycosyltransferase family 1 protein [Alphaproteobacteria bacterium]|nr:glycosyltransferase family 1 protein [Alphaproteobacteria bacterium]MBV9860848.1 glycosyltransferase family 1 protein [Alphaproteobacteria bacterium]